MTFTKFRACYADLIRFSLILAAFLLNSGALVFSQEDRESVLLKDLSRANDDSARVDILVSLCDLATYTDGRKGLDYFDRLREVAGRSGHMLGLARAWERVGNIYFHMGIKDSAAYSYAQAYRVNEEFVGDYEISASVMYNLGNVNYELGRFDSAIYYANRAGEIFMENADSMGYAASRYLTIGIYKDMGDYSQAMSRGLEALRIFRNLENRNWEIFTLNNMADLYNILGEYDKSLEVMEEVLAHYREDDNQKFVSVALRFIGDIHMELENDSLSLQNLSLALEVSRKGGFLPEEIKTLYSLANLYYNLGDYEESLKLFREGMVKSREASDGKFIASNTLGEGKSLYSLEEYSVASEKLRASIPLLSEVEDPNGLRDAWLYLSKSLEKTGDYPGALSAYKNYSQYHDTLLRAEMSDRLASLNYQYEVEQMEEKVEGLQQQKELAEVNRRNLWLILILTSITGLALISLFYLRSRKNRQLLNKEKEVDRMKDRFFANISHEFRTPLTLILSPVYELRKKAELAPHTQVLSLIERNARRLLHLVNEILELSRLDSGRTEVHYQEEEVHRFILKRVNSFHSLAESRNITMELQIHNGEERFVFDPDKLETLINNLLGNALKFEPEGGKVFVGSSIATRQGRRFLMMEVGNQGTFISEKEQKHLFDRYYRSPDPVAAGTGIGLALVNELVKVMNGKVMVDSDPSAGTFFKVELPEGKPEKGKDKKQEFLSPGHVYLREDEPSSDPSVPKDKSLNGEGIRVLVVEDNAEVRDFIYSCLREHYYVDTAVDGSEGIRTALETIPDIIISDVMMPGADGNELTRTLKSNEKTSHIPIVLLTAKASEDDRLEGLSQGADDYLVKPFNTRELLLRMENLMRLRKEIQKKYSGTMLYQPSAEKIQSVDQRFIAKIIRVIEENLSNEEFSVEELGREIGMSRSQLHRKLVALTDSSASTFIRNYRLKRAYELLSNRAGSISEIAYLTGFTSPSYFTKCFRETYGKTPGELVS